MQVVPGKTAAHAHGLVMKQLRSIGAITWDDVLDDMRQPRLDFDR